MVDLEGDHTSDNPAGRGDRSSGRAVVVGPARLGKRTKELVRHLRRGDIAIIDHSDLDRVAAEDLRSARPAAVINTSSFSTGAYPNMGPLILAEAKVPLFEAREDLFELFAEGDTLTLDNGVLKSPKLDRQVSLRAISLVDVQSKLDRQRDEIGGALEAFARNTVEHILEERELLSGKLDLPPFSTDFRDRHTLVVVRGVGHKRDLKTLRPYLRDMDPVLLAVDGGADACLDAGYTPSMIVGDMDSASEQALRCGAELVVHAYSDGRAPGQHRVADLGLDYKTVSAPGTSQDIAMLIALERGSSLIVSVGSQFNLIEFLEKSRRGMSSTFLTRLRIGDRLVDAKGVSQLYRPLPRASAIIWLLCAGLLLLLLVIVSTPGLREVADLLWLKLQLLLGIE